MNDSGIVRSNLLLFGQDFKHQAGRDRYHCHSCWQIELPCCGKMKALFEHEALTVSNGDLLIIPPGFRHAFEYNSQAYSTWSLKFNISGLSDNFPVRLLPPDQIFSQIRHFIEAVLKGIDSRKQQVPSPNSNKVVFIESLIDALVSYVYFDNEKETFPLANKVRSIIKARNGGALTVTEAAEKMGYSRNHLSLLFKQEYGIPLKTFIDQERVEIAKSLLTYTDMNISETARAMGFNDVYYFSNFFKRTTGISPLNYQRNKNNLPAKTTYIKHQTPNLDVS